MSSQNTMFIHILIFCTIAEITTVNAYIDLEILILIFIALHVSYTSFAYLCYILIKNNFRKIEIFLHCQQCSHGQQVNTTGTVGSVYFHLKVLCIPLCLVSPHCISF